MSDSESIKESKENRVSNDETNDSYAFKIPRTSEINRLKVLIKKDKELKKKKSVLTSVKNSKNVFGNLPLIKRMQQNPDQISDDNRNKMNPTKYPKKRSLFGGFSEKEKGVIEKALKIIKVREEEKRGGRELKKEVVREQVEKTKEIFLMGMTRALIKREKAKMQSREERGKHILKAFEHKMMADNYRFKEEFNIKKQEANEMIIRANQVANNKNRVVEELKRKSKLLCFTIRKLKLFNYILINQANC